MRTAESVVLTDWPPGPRRAVDVDLQVALVDLDLGVLRFRHHSDGRGRRVDASGGLGLGHALHAMRAALELEDRVRAIALDREHAFLQPAAVVRVRLDLLELEPAALGVALQHPLQLGRPERRLVAADALADLDDHVLVVGRVALGERELQLFLEPRDLGFVVGDHLAELGVAARGLEVGARLPPLLREVVRPFELLQPPADVGRLVVVVVDRGIGEAITRLGVGALELRDQVVECGHCRRSVARALARELCVEADVRDSGERLRHGAVLLCILGALAEAVFVEPGHGAADRRARLA